MSENHLKWYNKTLHHYLTSDEIKMLMRKSDWKAWLEILDTWLWIAVAFAITGFFPHPVTILISLFILGGKQLACAIILHDCSHESMFHSRFLNRFVGNWLGAYPILHDVDKYRPYHLRHHMYTGLDTDPDLPLTQGYPAGKWSMMRKFLRDFLGLSGIKSTAGLLLMQLGFVQYALNGKVEWVKRDGTSFSEKFLTAVKNLAGPLASNALMFFVLALIGKPWLYLLWPGALLTTYNFCIRVRSMAEHSMVADRTDPHSNTRTTHAGFVEKMLFAPHHVNYHAEHHLCMGIPSYNLPVMHRLLMERGYYTNGSLEPDYRHIVQRAIAE